MFYSIDRARVQFAALPLLALLACGCASQKIYATNQATLVSALTDLESGEEAGFERAEASATSVLASTGDVAEDYEVQRFFAQYLIARAHMQASAEGPFLTEPKLKSDFMPGGGDNREPSPTAHLVATCYHAGYALEWQPRAVGKPLRIGEQALLPPELEALGVEAAQKHMQLCILACFSRLLFQEQANRILEGIQVNSVASLEGIIAEGAATAEMKPWLYRAMWSRLKITDPREAYKYAARTLESADALRLGANNIHAKDIGVWLDNDSFEVVCPNCKALVNANRRTCSSCQKSEWRDGAFRDKEQ